MKKIIAVQLLLLFTLPLPGQSQSERNLGFYLGGGLRKQDRSTNYNNIGFEGGVTFRNSGKSRFRMLYCLGGTFDYYDFDLPAIDNTTNYKEKIGGFEALVRPEFALMRKERFSLYGGAGFNLNYFFSFQRKYRSVYYDPPKIIEQDWENLNHKEELYFGFNAAVSGDFTLTEKLKMNVEIALISKLRLEFTSSKTYTGQNLRVTLVRVF